MHGRALCPGTSRLRVSSVHNPRWCLWCSFWNRTKDDADRLGDKAEAKFNRWGDRISESVEDTKHAVQVRPPPHDA